MYFLENCAICNFLPPLAQIELFKLQFLEQHLPLLPRDESRGIHQAAIADHEAILTRLFRHGEVSVLNGDHSTNQVLLEVHHLPNAESHYI